MKYRSYGSLSTDEREVPVTYRTDPSIQLILYTWLPPQVSWRPLASDGGTLRD